MTDSPPSRQAPFLRRGCLLVVIIALALLSGTQGAQADLTYDVRIEGVIDSGLRNTLRSAAQTVELQERPPSTVMLLYRRAERDIPRLIEVLQAEGYYGAQVELSIEEERTPIRVRFTIEKGPRYTLADVRIDITDRPGVEAVPLPTNEEMQLETDTVVRASALLAAQRMLVQRFRENGFPRPQGQPPRIEVDHDAAEIVAVFAVDPGPVGYFGATTIEGLESVEEDYVSGLVPWDEGDLFSSRLVRQVRQRLNATGLFAVVDVVEEPDESNRVPMTVSLTERKHRTIRAELHYRTDEGAGLTAGWEHRNYRGRGQRLILETTISEIGTSFDASYAIPDFRQPDQTLRLYSRLEEDNPDAYKSQSLGMGASVERALSEHMSLGFGVNLRGTEVEQRRRTDQFALLSFPMFFSRSTADDPLAPTRGDRLRVEATPFQELTNLDLQFLRGSISYTRYQQLRQSPRMVLAGRIATGTILGTDYDRIPADERFYVGGGGSVRGFAYQLIGPLDEKTPLGGRSYLETSVELRMDITNTIGMAVFLDGGAAFKSEYPDFSETMRWGAGTGLRYNSPVGPFRLDVAMPINRRSGIDDAFQVYAGLGHAF